MKDGQIIQLTQRNLHGGIQITRLNRAKEIYSEEAGQTNKNILNLATYKCHLNQNIYSSSIMPGHDVLERAVLFLGSKQSAPIYFRNKTRIDIVSC